MQRKVKGTTRAWWKIHPWPKEPCVYLHQQPGRVQRSVFGIRLSASKPGCSLRAKRYSGKLVNLGLLTLRQTIFFDLNTTPSNLNHEFYSKYPRHTQTVQTVWCAASQRNFGFQDCRISHAQSGSPCPSFSRARKAQQLHARLSVRFCKEKEKTCTFESFWIQIQFSI